MAEELLSLVSALTMLLSLVFLIMMAAILGFGVFVLRNVSMNESRCVMLIIADPLNTYLDNT